MIDRYNTAKSWEWNLKNAPAVSESPVVDVPSTWHWCGLPVSSPLGISAGPLLNSHWLLYYAHLGFDVLVYKTVRSAAHGCYSVPNLVPVSTSPLTTPGLTLPQADQMAGSWAVSFGMPSQAPEVWRRDITEARRLLPAGKVLVVSVVGAQCIDSKDDEESLQFLADDFAQCAQWAVDAGAHGIEANFSCPNVATADGQLYQHPEAAGFIARRIREEIGDVPLVLKIGRLLSENDARDLVNAVGPFVTGLAMTNSIAAKVVGTNEQLLFDGSQRGICGDAIRQASVEQVAMFHDVVKSTQQQIDLIGVGGISTADHAKQYLHAGATTVALATSVMTAPDVGLQIRREW